MSQVDNVGEIVKGGKRDIIVDTTVVVEYVLQKNLKRT